MKEVRYAFEIGQILSIGDIQFKIIERDFDLRENKHIKKYLCECSNCHNSSWKQEKYLKRCIYGKPNTNGFSCRKCRVMSKEKNFVSIAESDPWAIELFSSKENAYNVSRGSGKYLLFRCPVCKEEKKIQVKQVIRDHGVKCQKCTDGFSYPNKFGLALLKQLPVKNLQTEFSDEWTNNKRYDFSFEYGNIHYLLEMDGEMHYNMCFNQDLNEIKKNDKIKDELALVNNCKLIRINCMESDFQYIKSSILESELNNIFDLSLIDWGKIKKDCLKNKIIEINDYYNQNKNKTVAEIAAVFNLSYATVSKYLKICAEMNLNDYMTVVEKHKKNCPIVLDLYKQGYSIKKICERLNLSYIQVTSCLKKEGVKYA